MPVPSQYLYPAPSGLYPGLTLFIDIELSPRTQEMLNRLPPYYRFTDLAQMITRAEAAEFDLFDAQTQELIANVTPQNADRWLSYWENVFNLPPDPAGVALAQRRSTVLGFFRKINQNLLGGGWEQRVTELIGAGWAYAEGHPLGIRGRWLDRFEGTTLSPAWIHTAGQAYTVRDGMLLLPNNTSPVFHREGGEIYADWHTITHFRVTENSEAGSVGAILKYLDTQNQLWAYVDNGKIALAKVDNNVFSNITTTAYSVADITEYWLRAEVVDNVVNVELWDVDPLQLAGTPVATITDYTLAGANATKFGLGVLGFGGFFTVNSSWPLLDHQAAEAGYVIPGKTIRITIPFVPNGPQVHAVEKLIRAVTPSSVDIQVFYEEGFILGVSELGEEAL